MNPRVHARILWAAVIILAIVIGVLTSTLNSERRKSEDNRSDLEDAQGKLSVTRTELAYTKARLNDTRADLKDAILTITELSASN